MAEDWLDEISFLIGFPIIIIFTLALRLITSLIPRGILLRGVNSFKFFQKIFAGVGGLVG